MIVARILMYPSGIKCRISPLSLNFNSLIYNHFIGKLRINNVNDAEEAKRPAKALNKSKLHKPTSYKWLEEHLSAYF